MTESSKSEERLASTEEVAERLRAGMDQHRAEVAALNEIRLGPDLLGLERSAYVQEPIPISPRPLLGTMIVLIRKLVYHLFLKWYVHPVVKQQNSFNYAASRRIQELLESNRILEQKLEDQGRDQGQGS